MPLRPAIRLGLLGLALVIAAPRARAVDAPAPKPATLLAVVNGDSVTTADLDRELELMRERNEKDAPVKLPPADAVLRRLVQNVLLTQEGYRMGADRKATVQNQIKDAVRRAAYGALLDSIAASVPAGAPKQEEARKAAVKAYVDGLKKQYGAKVDTALLASLDYASADTTVQGRLRADETVVATVSAARLTVRGLTREIRFTYFHGLQDRPDAAAIRDRACDEWVTEELLGLEIKNHQLERRPAYRRAARALEADLVREDALQTLAGFTFKPSDAEVSAWYKANLPALTPPPQVKVQSALLKDEMSARQFARRLQQGATFSWLVDNTPEVQKGITPFPDDWLPAPQMGLRPEEAVKGKIPEPYEVPGGWAVAVVYEVQPGKAPALADVRQRVLAMMKSERTRTTIKTALERLEAASTIVIEPQASALVTQRLAAASGGKP